MLAFEKWQGLGNDFILVEGDVVSSEQAKVLCHRRYGIGADGVLCLTRLAPDKLRMVVRNADGSRPEMCGNGLRCAVGWAALRGASRSVMVVTDAGEMVCQQRQLERAGFEVSANMGVATVGETFSYLHQGKTWSFARVDIGNPHAVSFDAHVDADTDAVGPALERHVTGGINVELCRVDGDRLQVAVWERGVGRTLACGTGACAALVAACAQGMTPFGEGVEVVLPGGSLTIIVDDDRAVTMRGPAGRVYTGQVDL